jgi:hypothetical protein
VFGFPENSSALHFFIYHLVVCASESSRCLVCIWLTFVVYMDCHQITNGWRAPLYGWDYFLVLKRWDFHLLFGEFSLFLDGIANLPRVDVSFGFLIFIHFLLLQII